MYKPTMMDGLQVLFDNIIIKCEIKWLSTLNMNNMIFQIINPSPFSIEEQYTQKIDVKNDQRNGDFYNQHK